MSPASSTEASRAPAPPLPAAGDPSPSVPDPRPLGAGTPAWLRDLQAFVESHEAVEHPLFARLARPGTDREVFRRFGLQHHALVGFFNTYMETLLIRAPSSREKLWLAKVLVDEYGEGSDGHDHATLYRAFLRDAGAAASEEERTVLVPEALDFVREHLRLCREEPFLVGMGALGPGHEWAIPRMFGQLLPSMRAAGLADEEIRYFLLHVEQDEHHGSWMTEVLAEMASTPEQQAQVRRGAERSLAARAAFWSGVLRVLDEGVPREGAMLGSLEDAVRAVCLGGAWPEEP